MLFCTFSCCFSSKRYAKSICEYAAEYGVLPALVFAICETESHFDPRAVSPVGAVGLMQIMPSTGEWIASRLGIDYESDMLFDPLLNLRFGTFYLSYLSASFSEKWQVVAAYNAGEGVVRGWIEEGITETTIPYRETFVYVRRVNRVLARYEKYNSASGE